MFWKVRAMPSLVILWRFIFASGVPSSRTWPDVAW